MCAEVDVFGKQLPSDSDGVNSASYSTFLTFFMSELERTDSLTVGPWERQQGGRVCDISHLCNKELFLYCQEKRTVTEMIKKPKKIITCNDSV